MPSPSQIAIVTGAGSGIGRAVALGLLAKGWSVVLAGRRVEALDETARLARVPEERLQVVPTDVTDPGAVKFLFEQIRETFGRLDLLLTMPASASRPFPWRKSLSSGGAK